MARKQEEDADESSFVSETQQRVLTETTKEAKNFEAKENNSLNGSRPSEQHLGQSQSKRSTPLKTILKQNTCESSKKSLAGSKSTHSTSYTATKTSSSKIAPKPQRPISKTGLSRQGSR
jgi:hypothetical protein